MGELLPTLAAASIRDGLLDYLRTTFALADQQAARALDEFLDDPEGGIFKGPYVRLRLPFRAADDGWRDAVGWHPTDDGHGFAPYGHQARALERLSSLPRPGAEPGPRPTLITTGTGSGKTEAFLYPILDHVLRANRAGVIGTKALILYPMNALAHDQAGRLAELITSSPTLRGHVTAGIYTGDGGPERTRVSADGLISSRYALRESPPDILLTNYKMLDQLLLRRDDARIWEQAAKALRYLVLDEFHTYDGAQGTDVAMLLRRLGLMLKAHGAVGDDALAGVTPVATSATLGDQSSPVEMLKFAQTVFGAPFDDGAVITESRRSLDEWLPAPEPWGEPSTGEPLINAIGAALEALGADPEPAQLAAVIGDAMYVSVPAGATLAERARHHPIVASLLAEAGDAVPLTALARVAFGATAADSPAAVRATAAILALLSRLRRQGGPSWPSLETHLWVRELTRIDREATAAPAFRWSDDGQLAAGSDDGGATVAPTAAFPAVYCRHCGRSGWGVVLSPAGDSDLAPADANIRRESAAGTTRFRALIAEGDRTTAPLPGESGDLISHVRWFHPVERRILATAPEGDGGDVATLRVVVHTGPDAGDRSTSDTCPACGQRDGIRFLGSSVATQLSVALSTLFGTPQLDSDEKKTLIFTDSVQDAAHRAGFIQARSRSLTLRSMLAEAIGDDDEITLDRLGARIIERAGDDQARRYRVLPPELAEHERFKAFWEAPTLAKAGRRVTDRVERRASFDATLEFGLSARLGRTLELTGTIAAEVDASAPQLRRAAERAFEEGGLDVALLRGGEERLVAWARGMVEHMRTSGAIRHPWLEKLIEHDGNRYFIWRGRQRSDGMPAFPKGRSAPAFPRIGPKQTGKRENFVFDEVTSTGGWYADWTARSLHLPNKQGAIFARLLLSHLAKLEVVTAIANPVGATIYALEPRSIVLRPLSDKAVAGTDHRLTCDTCAAEQVSAREAIHQLAVGPCSRPRCGGRLTRTPGDLGDFYRRFYRSRDARRVVAREHTSLLDDRERAAYESAFRDSSSHPGAPNVLVATPTLEMGIDIGDLSTVMLASLPRHVASYLQRVGRAGRRTGSALDLAFVPGQRHQLPQLSAPLDMINGAVRPPATYLDAEELLRRQFVAALADAEARDPLGVRPQRARDALGAFEPDSYLGALARRAKEQPALLDQFLDGFADLSEATATGLKAWVHPMDDAADSLERRFAEAVYAYRAQLELLQFRAKEIETVLPDLKELADSTAASDDEKFAYRSAVGALALARRQITEMEGTGKQGGFWVSALERAGILPNYTLRDDVVELDVGLSWQDPETLQYENELYTLGRGASLALREFAPGATFYSRGHQLKVDSVDLGHNGEEARLWALCGDCGYEHDLGENGRAPTTCPRCGSGSIADVSQQLRIVELKRVSSSMRRDDAIIDDSREQRERESFEMLVSADYDAVQIRDQWYADGLGFGLRHVGRITVRWLNLGRATGTGAPRLIAGQERPSELFRLCSECGHRDSTTGSNAKHDHRPWCSKRDAHEESSITVALSHHLETEGVLVEIPPYIALGSVFALPSLAAAVRLGLWEHFGGAPDHLTLATVRDPAAASPGGEPQDALLLHDTVPGGTGYLSDLADPQVMRRVLEGAYDVVRRCDCADGDRIACHRCLLAFAPWGQDQWVSRAEAERQLRTLLGGGDEADSPLEPWSITKTPPERMQFESRLEQRFRRAFRERVQALAYTVQEYPSERGDRWVVTASMGRRWTLEPQVLIGRARPDFVLHSEDPAVPDVAIFCDGERFHAGRAINRLADDAEKREELRAQGLVVVALTWADLEGEADVPAWYADDVAKALTASGQLGLRAAHLETMQKGALDLLASWMQQPARADLETVGGAVPLFMVAANRATATHPIDRPLEQLAAGILRNNRLAAGDQAGDLSPVWAWWAGSLAVLGRKVGSGTDGIEVAVVLNDSPATIEAGNGESWRAWLRLSMLLGARVGPTTITVLSRIAGAEPPADHQGGLSQTVKRGPAVVDVANAQRAVDASAHVGPGLSAQWAALAADATEDERPLVLALAEQDAVVPEYGPEVEGIPLGLAWTAQRITVDDPHFTDEDRELVRAAGWRIVSPTSEAIIAALNGGS